MVFGKTPLYRLWKGRMSAFWRRRRLMKLLRLAAVPEGARIWRPAAARARTC